MNTFQYLVYAWTLQPYNMTYTMHVVLDIGYAWNTHLGVCERQLTGTHRRPLTDFVVGLGQLWIFDWKCTLSLSLSLSPKSPSPFCFKGFPSFPWCRRYDWSDLVSASHWGQSWLTYPLWLWSCETWYSRASTLGWCRYFFASFLNL